MSEQAQSLVPGMHVQPCATTIMVERAPVADGTHVVAMRIEHGTGMTIVFLDREFAKTVAKMLLERKCSEVL